MNYSPRVPMSLLTVLLLASAAFSYPLPAASSYVNVKSLGAKGDGVSDDTQILKQALCGSNGYAYFPNGTYLVKDRLLCTYGNAAKRRTVHGESRAGVVIRLADNCPGYQDTLTPKAVLSFESGFPDQNFYNYVEYLTIDVGRGNRGAVGLNYQSANCGAVSNVTIRSSDPSKQGFIGLGLIFGNQGPALVRDLDVSGFDYGIRVNGGLHLMTFDKIILRDQRRAGVHNLGIPMAIRSLNSYNSVPAVLGRVTFALLDSKLDGPASTASAIDIAAGAVLLRRVTVGGYQSSLKRITVLNDAKSIDEFLTMPPLVLFPPADPLLFALPAQDIPMPASEAVTLWKNSADNGATDVGIQKTIDAGATTLFIASQHTISNTIFVRNKVRRIICLSGNKLIRASGDVLSGAKPMFTIQDGIPDTVVIEKMEIQDAPKTFVHASTRALVLRDIGAWTYENTVRGGRLFMDNVTIVGMKMLGQKVWMRQINPERDNNPKLLNDGGQVWILGVKTEHAGTVIKSINRGRTEVMGGSIYPTGGLPAGQPCFESINSHLSAACILSRNFGGADGFYSIYVRDTWQGQTREQATVASFYCGPSDGTVRAFGYPQQRTQSPPPTRQVGNRLVIGPGLPSGAVVHVIDPAGRTAARSVAGSSPDGLDLESLAPGPYIIRIHAPGAAAVDRRFVIERSD